VMLKSRLRWTVGIVMLASSVAGVLAAQTPTSPAFEAASVKPNKSGSLQVNFTPQPGGRLTATNVSLMDLIRMAYGTAGPFPLNRVVGGASWLASDRFDIVAKAEGDSSTEQMQLMMRSLIAERFKVAVHHETRERPIYSLVLARKDGRIGPGLRHSDLDCSGPSPLSRACELSNLPGKLIAASIPMETLARMLVQRVDDHREVRDHTGLAGNFDVTIEWTPSQMPQRVPDGLVLPPIDPNGPSLFTAIQEQLGLKLEPEKDQSDVLVIDHAEQPTAD
jgi:uncharacterized protein (TIGR03435 family)